MEVTSQSYTESVQSYIAFFAILYSSAHGPIYQWSLRRAFSHKQPDINSDRPKEMSQWLTPWGDRFVRVATRAVD